MSFEMIQLIMEDLLLGKFQPLILLIIALGGAMCFFYIKTTLAKTAELIAVNENFKNQLNQHMELLRATNKVANENFDVTKAQQVALTEATTSISESLKRESTSHQIFLSNYHAKSVAAIDAVYLSLIHLQAATTELSKFSTDEQRKVCRESTMEFIKIFANNRIWLPCELVSSFENHFQKMTKLTSEFIYATEKQERIPNLKEKEINKLIDQQEKFYDYIYGELNQNTQELVDAIIKFLARES